MNKETTRKIAALRRAIDKELKSLGTVTIPGIEGVSDWMTKTWSNLKKSDLKENRAKTLKRNALSLAKRNSLPLLVQNLEKNHFRSLIMDLALKIVEDQFALSEPDSFYALELALELSQVNGAMPVHSLLLNAIHNNADTYGSLDDLRRFEDSAEAELLMQMKTVNLFYSNERLPEAPVEATVEDDAAKNLDADRLDGMRAKSLKSPIITPPVSGLGGETSTDSQLFMTDLTVFDGFAGDVTFIEQRASNVRQSRKAVVSQWLRIEERVRFRVEALRVGSPDEAYKQELRERQKAVEALVRGTEDACADEEELAYFKELMLKALPEFKSAMGKNISKRPELAKQVYDVLDKLAEHGVALHEYLDAAIALSKASDSRVLAELLDSLSFGELGSDAATHVLSLIETREKKSKKKTDPSVLSEPAAPVSFASR